MIGWIRIHRQITDHWIWKDPVKLKWWLDILLTVNHTDAKVNIGLQIFECKRGQSIMSLSNWAGRWGVSKDKARNFLVLLEKDGMILHESLGKTTRITICNYDSYQGDLHDSQTIAKRKVTAKSPQSHTNNNDNNNNNKNNDNNSIDMGETEVSQHTPEELNKGDFEKVLLESGVTTPSEGETPLNGKSEENNYPIESQEKKKSCAKKEKKVTAQFQKPTLEEVAEYCAERGNIIDHEKWFDYYTANGWKVGKNPMRDWKAAVRTWERNGIESKPAAENTKGALITSTSKTGFTSTI